MKNLRFFLFLFATLAFAACSDDDDTWASYRQDLVCLDTDASGCVTTLTRDDGTILQVSNTISGLQADSTYRALALYVEQTEAATAKIYDYATILAPEPVVYSDEVLVTDPLSVVACWEGGNYINLHLALLGTVNVVHYFGFHVQGFVINTDLSYTLHLSLLHDQNDDPLSYTRETYICLPLSSLSSLLRENCDSLALHVNTFDGEETYTFAY